MNKDSIYKERHQIKSTEVNSLQELSLAGLLKIIQNLSVDGSEYVGAGKDKTLDSGFIWVFSRLEFNVIRMPKYLEEVYLYTYTNEMMHYIYPRTYLIKDLNDNLLVKATSLWFLIDINKRKIVMPSESGIGLPSDIKADKVNKIEVKDVELRETRIVRYSDVDVNLHLNNVRYFDFISDLNDSSFHKNHIINHVNISFHQEVKEGEKVDIYASGDNTYFKFMLGEKCVFECNIFYE